MIDSDYFHSLTAYSVHNAIVAVNDFAESVVTDFGNDATRSGKPFEMFDSGNQTLNQELSIACRVAGYVRLDRLNVFDGLEGPDNPRHLRRRSLATSCETVSSASA